MFKNAFRRFFGRSQRSPFTNTTGQINRSISQHFFSRPVVRFNVYCLIGGTLFASLTTSLVKNVNATEEENSNVENTHSQGKDEDKDDNVQDDVQSEYEKYDFMIIGGGVAAFSAVEELKKNNVNGSIIIITDENQIPYQKPPLSKDLWFQDNTQKVSETLSFLDENNTEESIFFKPLSYYDKENIRVIQDIKVLKMNSQEHIILLSDGTILMYDKCLIATGSRPQTLQISHPEHNPHITTFSNIEDFKNLYDVLHDPQIKHVTVIGGGFIGGELVLGLANKGKETNTQIAQIIPETGVMGKYFPSYLSEYITKKMRNQDIDIHTNAIPTEISQKSQEELTIKLQDGTEINTNHIVVAIGTVPNTHLAEYDNLEIDPINNGIVANVELQVKSDLWVAGDVVSFWAPNMDKRIRVDHYLHAYESGKIAAKNMLGEKKPYQTWPLFWGRLFDNSYTAFGNIDTNLENIGVWQKGPIDSQELGEDNIYERNSEYKTGIVYYLKDKKVVGILFWNMHEKLDEALSLLERKYSWNDYSDLRRCIPFEATD